MDKKQPTKNMFLSSLSLKPQPEKPVEIQKASEVIAKKPYKKPANPFKQTKQVRNTDGLVNVEINGINLNAQAQVKKQQNKPVAQQPAQQPQLPQKQERLTTYSTSAPVVKPKQQKPKKLNTFEKITQEQQFDFEEQPKPVFQSKSKNSLKVMFLGGVGEIGKNMMALEYGRDIIIIDCGSTFPYGELMPGIDLVVPEISYLTQNKDKIRGIVVTHGHEDHIGAMPYVLNEIEAPVYASKLTTALIQNKLREFPKIKAKLNAVKPNDVVKLGCFSIEFIRVNHSIAGAMALAITSPVGVMLHTGDFKIDFTPIDGKVTDLSRLAELGRKGVLLLTCESTNVERAGYSMSESNVAKTLDELFKRYNDDRIVVATFASNVYRLQQLLSLAEKYKRKVTFTGRSMQNVTETAYKIGELKFDPKIFIDIDDIGKYPDNEILVISTGSQGEPMSALTRMASGEFQKIKLGEHDTVIFSSSPIPGNEKQVNVVINQLYRLGCNVIYNSLEDVHASGHAYQEEIKLIHSLIKPKFFIPVHGEYRHLKIHKDLAVKMGMEARNVVIAEVGNVIEVNTRNIKVAGNIPSGERLVDGLGLGDSDSSVLRDRRQLAEDGLAVVVLGINSKTGEISSGPDIISRGLIYSNEMESLISEGKQVIAHTVENISPKELDFATLKNNVRKSLSNFFFKKTKRKPMVLTIVLEN